MMKIKCESLENEYVSRQGNVREGRPLMESALNILKAVRKLWRLFNRGSG